MSHQLTNDEWVAELEEVLDSLRDRRSEVRNAIDDSDIEASQLFAAAERHWRRIERKLAEAVASGERARNSARARNVDNLIQSIEEVYFDLEKLLD